MGKLTCADCGTPMAQVARSLPQGQARCQPCRRQARPERKPKPAPEPQPTARVCSGCHEHFEPKTPRQRFCSSDCWHRKMGTTPKPKRSSRKPKAKTTTDRGYGAAHQRERAKWAKVINAGRGYCWRCGRPIPKGTDWDLGHLDDDPTKTRYVGPEHVRCNRRAGALKGQANKRRRSAASNGSTTLEW